MFTALQGPVAQLVQDGTREWTRLRVQSQGNTQIEIHILYAIEVFSQMHK